MMDCMLVQGNSDHRRQYGEVALKLIWQLPIAAQWFIPMQHTGGRLLAATGLQEVTHCDLSQRVPLSIGMGDAMWNAMLPHRKHMPVYKGAHL